MGKRSKFERRDRDCYDTPWEAVIPLLPHLRPGTAFCEPCAGSGVLLQHLANVGHHCVEAWDIEPRGSVISTMDATAARVWPVAQMCITNPPWTRSILHKLIINLSDQRPTWLLFDADWVHTKQAIPFMPRLYKVVSVGRIRWIPGTKMTGKDNCAWHLFDTPEMVGEPIAQFFGRRS